MGCNQFGGQEPGSDEEVKKFATEKYNVTFDMFSKINVNGGDAHPLWVYLKEKQGGFLMNAIKWNLPSLSSTRRVSLWPGSDLWTIQYLRWRTRSRNLSKSSLLTKCLNIQSTKMYGPVEESVSNTLDPV